MTNSDVELLLEEPEQRQQVSFPRRAALALSLVGLAGLGLLAHRGSSGLMKRGPGGFVGEYSDCFEYGKYYAHPHKMAGTDRTGERSAEDCQQRCANYPGCAHFSYWPDGGCMLTGSESYSRAAPARFHATVSGPATCGGSEGAAAAPPPVDIDVPQSSAVGSADLEAAGLSMEGTSGLVSESLGAAAPPLPPSVPPVPAVKVMAGVNGTQCAKYPACMAIGMTAGDCCPTPVHVNLGCCHGLMPPKPLPEAQTAGAPKMAAGSACSSHPACMKLGLEGACCPAANGAVLGCCNA